MDENERVEQEESSQDPSIELRRESSVPKPARGNRKKKIGRLLLIVIPILLIIGGFVWFFFLREESEEVVKIESENQSQPTEIPTTTPIVSIDREEVSMQILNGSGIAGEATFLQGVMANLGYKDIEVGNADERGQETTVVTFSNDLPESVQNEIQNELDDRYESVRTSTSGNLDYDIVIVLGLRKGQALPTVTPTSKPEPSDTPSPTASPSATPTP